MNLPDGGKGWKDFKEAQRLVVMGFNNDQLINAICLLAIKNHSFLAKAVCQELFHNQFSEMEQRLDDPQGFLPREQGIKAEVNRLLSRYAEAIDAGQG